MKKIILLIVSVINKFYPKKSSKMVFLSSPDMSDNSFAFFKYIIENHAKKYTLIWLVDDIDRVVLYENMIKIYIDNLEDEKIEIVSRNSIKGLYHHFSSKYIFFTHGFYTGMSLSKKQLRVNLWHGMPLKALGRLHKDNIEMPKSAYTIATSKLFEGIMAKVFDMPKKSVLISGQPRCDLMYDKSDCLEKLGVDKQKYKKVIFWAPTYRRAIGKKIKDGNFENELPVVKVEDLVEFNNHLMSLNSCLIIKLHPMDVLNNIIFEKMSNIKIIKNNYLLENACQLYSLLSQIDVLITDFSSIYIDFLLLDRPIIFAYEDFESYMNSRGSVFDNPKEYMPGDFVNSFSQLKEVLSGIVLKDNDNCKNERRRLRKQFHQDDRGFSNRLYSLLDMK